MDPVQLRNIITWAAALMITAMAGLSASIR